MLSSPVEQGASLKNPFSRWFSIHLSGAAGVAVASLLFLNAMIGEADEPPNSKGAPPGISVHVSETKSGSPWQRIILIGASATAGFTESEPFGGTNTAHLSLARYVDAALRASHQPVRNFASALFFLFPDAEGPKEIREAVKVKPTLVVGLDFLFWFCYGDTGGETQRLHHLDEGLKLLDSLPCPLVVGDIPDASAAIGTMLRAEQVPTAETLAAANKSLRAWAARHQNVVIVHLSNFMRDAMANQAITIHGHTLARGRTRALLQPDKLHPTPMGCAMLALAILDAVQSRNSAASEQDVIWDAREVCRLGYELNFPAESNPTPRTPEKPTATDPPK